MSELRVVLSGVGRIGRDLTRLLRARDDAKIVAAYSRNPTLAGRDLGEIAGGAPLGVIVTTDASHALAVPADIQVIATTSFLRDVAPDIRAGVEHNLNVVCTAEELAFPWAVDNAIATTLDDAAKNHRVTILGTGLNPGFLSDAIVVTASSVAWDVERIRIRRVVNVSHFSPTILGRLGIGFTPEEFRAGTEAGTIYGHIGFPQSMHVVAHALGRHIDEILKRFQPLLTDQPVKAQHLEIQPGTTVGFRQYATAMVEGKPWYEAEFIGHVDPETSGFRPQDDVYLDGYNPVHLSFTPGLPARFGSVAVIANSLRRVVEAPPGLLTVADVRPARPTPTRGAALASTR